ncbi:MAG: DUF6268 family outer membrane beta-barrel protein [Candidatus Cloacimonetes bacterium]|nr:DUF6268 family outer membrane beta-barrel protein [Candidatus Cloacimonadota bacterium]
MRTLILYLLFISSLSALSSYKPIHLIESQPMPYFIKQDNSLSYLNENNRDYNITFDISAIPLISKRRSLLVAGGGFHLAKNYYYDCLNQLREAYYGNIFGSGGLSDNWYWITYQEIGVWKAGEKTDFSDSFIYFQLSGIGYKFRESQSIQTGVIYISNFGEPVIIPSICYVYGSPSFFAEFSFPSEMSFNYRLSDKKYISVGGRITNHRYRMQDEDVCLEESYSFFGKTATHLTGLLWISSELEVFFKRKISFRDKSMAETTKNLHFGLNISFLIKPEEKKL